MEIRYINKDDSLFDISSIYEQSWKYAYKGIIPQTYLDSIPKGRWANSSITGEGMNTLIMTENGCMIGTASFCRSRWKKYSDHGEIVSVYLLPDHIGKSYGRPLLTRCMEELHILGFDKLLLWVLEGNTAARKFYEKNGFTCTGEYMNDNIGGKELREMMYTFYF